MSSESVVRWAGESETGPVRTKNEDAWGILPEAGVAAVADGVGGGPGGERAARTAVEASLAELAEVPWPDADGKGRRSAVLRAHGEIVTAWRERPELAGMATTLTAVRWRNGRVEGVHVGDSRAYRLDPAGLEPLTRDHTPAGRTLERTGGDRELLRTHPERHLLLRALGGDEAGPEPDLFEVDGLPPGSVLVLCSDGVEAVLSEPRFRELLEPALEGDLDRAVHAVLDEVLRGGAPDNTTLLLVAPA